MTVLRYASPREIIQAAIVSKEITIVTVLEVKASIPGHTGNSVSIAATAGMLHPFPFRTRKLRYLTWMTVLRYASPREIIQAAIVLKE